MGKIPATTESPSISVGYTCVWMQFPNDPNPVAALVTRDSNRDGIISCTIFPPDNKGGIPKSAVRHASDPNWKKYQGNDNSGGVWDYPGADA